MFFNFLCLIVKSCFLAPSQKWKCISRWGLLSKSAPSFCTGVLMHCICYSRSKIIDTSYTSRQSLDQSWCRNLHIPTEGTDRISVLKLNVPSAEFFKTMKTQTGFISGPKFSFYRSLMISWWGGGDVLDPSEHSVKGKMQMTNRQ